MSVQHEIPVNRTLVPIPTRNEEPRIEVLRDGNTVRTIRISCTCGCEVDINCQYDQGKNDED